MNGQRARSGRNFYTGFEGGQTPLYIRMPKRGATNSLAKPLEALNLGKLESFIHSGKIDNTQPITLKTLHDAGIVGRIKHGVKLLGGEKASFSTPVNIEVTRASKSAIDAVERAGGSITCVYHNRLALRAHLKPEKFEGRPLPRRARPPPRLMPYYMDPENRGEFSILPRPAAEIMFGEERNFSK